MPESDRAASNPSLGRIEQALLAREFLYDSPSDYRDGVAAAIEAVRATFQERQR